MAVSEDRLLRPREVARLLDVAVSTLKAWRNREYGPKHKRLLGERGEIRYLHSEVVRFMHSGQFATHAQELASRNPDATESTPAASDKWWVK